MILRCGSFRFDLATTRVMGILNVTPDSFADGARYFFDPARALDHARHMAADGADLIDIGGESTRPGASAVTEAEELSRVIPLVEKLAAEGLAVSVDTRKPAVMRAAISAGAVMINDVSALRTDGAIEACASGSVGICLMHMQGEPATMQEAPHYRNVVGEVRAFLAARATACVDAGIARECIVVDPGFGFGKTLAHNLALIRGLSDIAAEGFPILAGVSRKSMLAALAPRAVEDRLAASLAAMLAAVRRGASIVRVHDVRETVDALKVWAAVEAKDVARVGMRVVKREGDS